MTNFSGSGKGKVSRTLTRSGTVGTSNLYPREIFFFLTFRGKNKTITKLLSFSGWVVNPWCVGCNLLIGNCHLSSSIKLYSLTATGLWVVIIGTPCCNGIGHRLRVKKKKKKNQPSFRVTPFNRVKKKLTSPVWWFLMKGN